MTGYAARYLEHLTDRDLDLIAKHSPDHLDGEGLRAELRSDPLLLERLLESPRMMQGLADPTRPLAVIPSPFLLFGVLINTARRELGESSYVSEWSGPGKRLPVFDAGSLKSFIDAGPRRYFMIEFLASFTRVASGVRWKRTRSGFRRQRYSELDLADLAAMVDELPLSRRPAGYRRLGDVALFLAGVFPDHAARSTPGPRMSRHLAASAGVDERGVGSLRGLDLYEFLGASWYRRAAATTLDLVAVGPGFPPDIADRFFEARRFLNHLADRHLFRVDAGLAAPG